MKDGKFGFNSGNLGYGSDAKFAGMENGYVAEPIPPQPQKKFGKNSGWPTATGETEYPDDMETS